MKRIRKAHKLIGYRTVGLIVIGLLLVSSYLDKPQRVEDAAFRFVSSLVASASESPKVAVLAIDEESVKKLGSWPLSRQVIADGVGRLKALKVRTIGLMVPLDETQAPPRLSEMYKQARESSPALRSALRKWARRFDSDRALSRAMGKAGNVVIAAEGRKKGSGELTLNWSDPEAPLTKRIVSLLDTLESLAFAPPASPHYEIRWPLSRFKEASEGVGVLQPGDSRATRSGVLLAVGDGDQIHPTFIAQIMARSLQSNRAAVEPLVDKGVKLGRKLIATPPDFRYYPPPIGNETAGSSLHVYSFVDLWNKRGHLKDLAGATVLVGPTVPGLSEAFGTPSGGGVAPVMLAANALASILEQSGFVRPAWFYGVQRALLLSLILLLLLPATFHGRRVLVVGAIAALLLLNAGLVGLVTRQVWLPVGLPALGFLCLTAALFARRVVDAAVIRVEEEAGDLRLRFAANLHAQDNLDDAFDEYRLCPPGKVLMERLYQLGLDYERRRKLDRAVQVYDFLRRLDAKYRDVRHRQARLEKLATQYPGLAPTGSVKDTVLVADTNLEKPALAHYLLERQIGRGAMARVYLATDQKLGRQVALKVLSIRDDYHGDDIDAVERRFRREAEAEAQMSHPNIVTVYESGKDRDLVYIAMDYVDGTTLEEFTDPDNLLTCQEVVEIGIQAAQALDYAHGKGIIHRDVKPSNILYIRHSRFVKVSDFGIARLNNNEDLTSTGTIMGTPSYMSPEQAVGEEIDGRSDLFSLGTTLYQLLAGKLPFTGDSVPNIMFQITTEKHERLSSIRPDIDAVLCKVIDKALKKDADKRFQSGQQMADALEACRDATSDGASAGNGRGSSRKNSKRRSSAA